MSHQAIAAKFNSWVESGDADRLEDNHGDVVGQVLDSLSIQAGEKILDLGCGNGWATRLLAKAAPGTQAIGIDASPQMIARADELHSFTIRARYDYGTFEELEFDDATFDRAFSMEALYYSPDPDKALSELFRVLKPGAVTDLVLDFYSDSPGTEVWSQAIGLEMCYRSEGEWVDALKAAGFADVEARRVIDSRGPGDEAAFKPSRSCPDWATRVSVHEAGSLWLHAKKPG
ncbi:MAG: class I SAM-dependent methyltransferase [Planctomycetota bacterium]